MKCFTHTALCILTEGVSLRILSTDASGCFFTNVTFTAVAEIGIRGQFVKSYHTFTEFNLFFVNLILNWRAYTFLLHIHVKYEYRIPFMIVRCAGLLWSQQDFEWRWSVPLFKCLTVLEGFFCLFDLCLLITFLNFIMNYVPIVTFWIFTYHQILSIMFCFIWSYWIIYFF